MESPARPARRARGCTPVHPATGGNPIHLYLIRHAIAENRDPARWPDDSQRPLTDAGEQRFRKAARGLARTLPPPTIVLASAYVRAWRTAELLAEEAGWPAPKEFRPLEAERQPSEAIPGLERQGPAGVVALVGHEPNLSRLASLLLSGGPDVVATDLKKGGAIILSGTDPPGPGHAVLESVFTPRTLRRLAR